MPRRRVKRPELLFPEREPQRMLVDIERVLIMSIAFPEAPVIIHAAQGLAAVRQEIQLKPLGASAREGSKVHCVGLA